MPQHGGPTWRRPSPYGAPESVQAAGTVAAPLLAGFTITLMGLVVDTSNQGIRHRDTALLVLMAAVASLIAAIQCAYSARRYMVLPDELTSWWPDAMDKGNPGRRRLLRQLQNEQFAHRLLHVQWADRFRYTYHAGILLMLAGLAVVLIPPKPTTTSGSGQSVGQVDISMVRWLAIILAGASALAEFIWITASWLNKREPCSRVGRLLVDGAGHLVPSYDERLLDARAYLAAMRLREATRALEMQKGVQNNLDGHLKKAAQSFEKGRRDAGRTALRLFKDLANFQGSVASSGLSPEEAAKLLKEADAIETALPP
jgi:hypothetical protein